MHYFLNRPVHSLRGSTVLLAALAVAPTLVACGSSASSAPSFAPPRGYSVGMNLAYAAIGDLNGDGKQDLATASGDGTTVDVLLSRGNGRFRAPQDYTTGAGPYSLAIGDVNGDGKPDLATANLDANTLSVLLNKGDGSFRHERWYATADSPESVAIGDLNGDGRADLVTGNSFASNPGSVSVFVNKGDGSFQPRVDYPTRPGTGSVAIGDLNRDGEPDLVASVGARAGMVSVFLNKGDGSFRAGRDYPTGHGPLSVAQSVAIGDLNGDRKPDLVTANHGAGNVSVFLNRGDGRFHAPLDYRAKGEPLSVAIGDLTGDGKPDLATADAETSVSVLVNKGDGSYQRPLTFRGGFAPGSIAMGDLNSDGQADLAIAGVNEQPSNVYVLFNRGRR